MADNDWRYNYFNLNNETDFWIRETHFVNDAGQSDFWTQSAYHRVFGLYVKRAKIGSRQKAYMLSICNVSNSTLLPGDYHRYALYWPNDASYPANPISHYYDNADQIILWPIGFAPECTFYQSITSMLTMSGQRGNTVINSQQSGQQQQQIDHQRQYLRQSARKQLGQHVFIGADGLLNTINCSIYLYTNRGNRRYGYFVGPRTSMNAIYPTIRNEWYERKPNTTDEWEEIKTPTKYQVLVRQVFTMGLAFRRFGPNNESLIYMVCETQSGTNDRWRGPESDEKSFESFLWNQSPDGRKDNRLYTRFRGERRCHHFGGGYDLTQELFSKICKQYDNTDNNDSDDDGQAVPAGAVGGATANQALADNTVFAVYVCAGAKLVVTDNYQESINNDHHNRSLFEQGSVVIVEDRLWMTVPYNLKSDTLLDVLLKWPKFSNKYLSPEMIERVKQFKNPVLFLGANESDYNTIVWNLTIENMGKQKISEPMVNQPQGQQYWRYRGRQMSRKQQNYLVSVERRCFLEVPEGGYIVGVEDWADGIREIEYRHKYEQLHRAIVRHQMPERIRFTGPHPYELPPGDEWLKKIILNTKTDYITVEDRLTGRPIQYIDTYERDIYIDIVDNTPDISRAYRQLMGQQFNEKDHSILPKEFNFSRFAELPPDPLNPVNNELIKTYRVSPAAYPPVKIRTGTDSDDYRLFYLPQTLRFKVPLYDAVGGEDLIEFNLLTVFKNYAMDPNTYSTYDNSTDIYPTKAGDANTYNNIRLVLSETKHPFKEYEWKCLNNPFIEKHLIENNGYIRLGIDGHFYRLVENTDPLKDPQHIGYIHSLYYELFDQRINDTIVANIPLVEEYSGQPVIGFDHISDDELYDLVQQNPFAPNPWPQSAGGHQSFRYRQSSGGASGSNTNQFQSSGDGSQQSGQNTQ